MSSEVAIKVENLSKCYQIYRLPQDRLKQSIYPRIKRLLGKESPQYYRDFWALKDISFEIARGQTIGIIGRNGSGKSTLLQLICGTLAPTTGDIQINGRVAALLELGAGFNPEFTGRENVYLNASILGLTRGQTDARFDRIAAFADIGDFINQPVKTYSSGMYVRLAFAVIAHVDADILVIDEALAVGDAVFTQKCMRYIRSFQERGTLLFVSHDMGSVLSLCKTGIWLGHGTVQKTGPAKAVSEAYLQYTLQANYGDSTLLNATDNGERPDTTRAESAPSSDLAPSQVNMPTSKLNYNGTLSVQNNLEHAKGWQTGVAKITAVTFEPIDFAASALQGGERVKVTIIAKAEQELDQPILGFLVRDRLGQDLFGENTLPFTDKHPRKVNAGDQFSAEFSFLLPMLPNGEYALMTSVADGTLHENLQHHFLHDALIFNVTSSKIRWGLVGIPFEDVTMNILSE